MLLQLLIYSIIWIFLYHFCQCVLVYICIVKRFYIIILRIAKRYDRIFQGKRTLLVGIGTAVAITAVNLSTNIIFVNVYVFLNI